MVGKICYTLAKKGKKFAFPELESKFFYYNLNIFHCPSNKMPFA